MRLISWNVNGIRAAFAKGLAVWLESARPDVLCLQETRADGATLPEAIRHLGGYESYWAPLRKAGYGGVATFCRQPATAWRAGLGSPDFDDEGRVLIADVGDVSVYNVYFPNGKANAERLAYKLAFYEAFLTRIDADARAGRHIVFCGDVNTAHQAIDIARPAENAKRSGFLPQERAWLDRCVAHGWVDTFRHLHPDTAGAYTWWDPRTRARARNVGWRLDYCFIHQRDLARVRDAGIAAEVTGSDHCPIWLDLAD
jgi:exodeoxyribonuclease-3